MNKPYVRVADPKPGATQGYVLSLLVAGLAFLVVSRVSSMVARRVTVLPRGPIRTGFSYLSGGFAALVALYVMGQV